MTKPRKRKRPLSLRPRGRPKAKIPTKAIAFRLPGDVVKLADKAAADQHISRNKLVELTLRAALEPGYAKKIDVSPDGQYDLFG